MPRVIARLDLLSQVDARRGLAPGGTLLVRPMTMPSPGDVIGGKYRLDAVLGHGGTSVVFRATHVHLGQTVAVKVLSPAALAVPEYVVRLEREARAVSRMRSEHVVRVFDVGKLEDGGAPYLVMDYLEGEDLAALLARRRRLPVELAVEYVLHACEALAEAHAMGIVHRDLKPANLFLTECLDGSPCVKVLDFGISRMSTGLPTTALTDPGMVVGTPRYMAPEQMESSDGVDARVDVWALGAILYELLVGAAPYQGETLPQIFMRIMRSKTPRPSAARSDVPGELDGVVARCLAVDPAKRFGSVAELAVALAVVQAPRVQDSAERVARVWERTSNPGGARAAARREDAVAPRPAGAFTPRAPRTGSFGAGAVLSPAVLVVALGALGVGFASTFAVRGPEPSPPSASSETRTTAALSLAEPRAPASERTDAGASEDIVPSPLDLSDDDDDAPTLRARQP